MERPGSGEVIEHTDPSTGSVVTAFRLAVEADIEEALAATRHAQPAWARTSIEARQTVLRRIAAATAAGVDDTAQIAAVESGSPIGPGAPAAGPIPAASFQKCAYRLEAIEGEVQPVYPADGFDYTRQEPDGVVGIITSTVMPFAGAAAAVAAAVAAGNAVVVVASAAAPFTPVRLARLCLEAGLPDGVVNVVVGEPSLADVVAHDPRVDKIVVSGDVDQGRRALVAAANQVRPVLLHLRGTSIDIVFADADIATAAASIRRVLVSGAATGIDPPTRILVDEIRRDELIAHLVGEFESLRLGPAESVLTEIGPRPTRDQLASAVQLRHEIEESGVEMIGGHRGDPDLPPGWYVPPALAIGTDQPDVTSPDHLALLLTVLTFRDHDPLPLMASDPPMTTVARLHTTSLARVHGVAREFPARLIVAGDDRALVRPAQPAVDDFLRLKNVYVDLSA
jgi:acyl-CoA reductase-like NAD-dependent aldehyde dehydrogenase